MTTAHLCRFCSTPLEKTVIDLGSTPLSNAYLSKEALEKGEIFFPLHARICEKCFLVQLPSVERPETIFADYLYFSSFSESWLAHASAYTDMMIDRFAIDSTWRVIEIASNDGYLLQFFKNKNIPVLGIEPADNVAEVARKKGIPTESVFFGADTAHNMKQKNYTADLLIANNVLAHVPNLNDFITGMKIILAKTGVLTIEFPHLLNLIEQNQFDTIYHEHFSYFSLFTVQKIFAHHDLTIFDVEELPTHGGSLRLFVKHTEDQTKLVSERVEKLLQREKKQGLTELSTYNDFSKNVAQVKYDLLKTLLDIKNSGKTIVGYGAPAKGNTLLNYFGVSVDLLSFTVDKNHYKQGKYLPGTRIPILSPDKIQETKPDYVLILPWNLKTEIMNQLSFIREWQGQFVLPIPKVIIC